MNKERRTEDKKLMTEEGMNDNYNFVDRPPSSILTSQDKQVYGMSNGYEEEILPTIRQQNVFEDNLETLVTTSTAKEQLLHDEHILDSIYTECDFQKFFLQDLEDYSNFDKQDGPPSIRRPTRPAPPTTESKRSYLTQIRSQGSDKEGIATKHTTYHPIPQTDRKSGTTNGGSHKLNGVYSDDYYEMKGYPRGVLTIINVREFTAFSFTPFYKNPRKGTNIDAERLTALFLDLGFIVERFDNPSTQEIKAIMMVAATRDYSEKSCCACAFLTHGDNGTIFGKNGDVEIQEIVQMFRTKELAGKPKLFIFQASRGDVYMDCIDDVDGAPKTSILALPSEADFLYAYSTVPGFNSWRNETYGSWFIEALVKTFRAYAHKMDVQRMLVQVNQLVANRYTITDNEDLNIKKQIPSFVSQLRKDFFLLPPFGPLES